MNDTSLIQHNSPSWLFFVKASFGLAAAAMVVGIWAVPAALWVKGYLAMGALYLMGSTFMLAKTLRDEFESGKLLNKIAGAKTERILKEYDIDAPTP